VVLGKIKSVSGQEAGAAALYIYSQRVKSERFQTRNSDTYLLLLDPQRPTRVAVNIHTNPGYTRLNSSMGDHLHCPAEVLKAVIPYTLSFYGSGIRGSSVSCLFLAFVDNNTVFKSSFLHPPWVISEALLFNVRDNVQCR
jgi:hypothetical protein